MKIILYSFLRLFSVLMILLNSLDSLNAQYKITTAQLNNTRFQQVKGGLISNNAIKVDADNFFSVFNKGVAVIRKGNAYALMNAKGELVVPFNKYQTISSAGPLKDGHRFVHNGLFSVSTTNVLGYINHTGKLIVSTASDRLLNNGLYFENTLSKPYTYTQWDGKVFKQAQHLTQISENIGYSANMQSGTSNGSYRRLNGDIIFSGEIAQPVRSFSNGLAAVGKKDNYGVVKYGFIDTTGKTVIDYQFSIAPSDFSNGFARVQPVDKTSFEYGFINKKGELVWKHTREQISTQGRFNSFANGLSMTPSFIMDTLFSQMTFKKLFEQCGLQNERVNLRALDEWQKEGLYPILPFYFQGKMNQYNRNVPDYGFINLVTGKVIMPAFYIDGSKHLFVFDPVSKLAYAKMIIGKTASGQPIVMDGFINEDGEFVLIKAEKSLW